MRNSTVKNIIFAFLLASASAYTFASSCPGDYLFDDLENTVCSAEEAMFYNVGSGKTKAHHIQIAYNGALKVLKSTREYMPYSSHISEQALSDHGKDAGIETFEKIEKDFGVSCQRIRCLGIATAWAREATNAHSFLSHIHDYHGVKIKILTQEEEALYSYEVLRKQVDAPNSIMMLDIGGGSLQVVSPKKNDTEPSILGLAYGGERFKVETLPCLQASYSSSELNSRFLSLEELDIARNCQPYKDIAKLQLDEQTKLAVEEGHLEVYGIGGLINTAVKGMLSETQTYVTLEDLTRLQELLSSMSIEEAIQKYPRIPEIRGNNFNLLLLESVMKGLGISKIVFADSYFGEEDLALAVFSHLHSKDEENEL